MKFLALLIALAAFNVARGESAQDFMQKGRAHYAAGEFDLAATNFSAAAEAAPAEKLDAAAAKFNEATANLQLGKADEAARRYAEAVKSPDLRLQQRAYYNRGNALLATAAGLEQAQKFDGAVKSAGEAIQMFENAMALDSRDEDPKVNFELAVRKKTELEEKLKQQQQQQQQNQQENQQDQQKKDQDQQNQDQKSQDQQDQQQKKDQQDQSQEQKPQDEKEKPPQNGQSPEDQEKPKEPQDGQTAPGQPVKPEEMTPEEAALLLDAAKEQEQAAREKVQLIMGRQVPVEKDW